MKISSNRLIVVIAGLLLCNVVCVKGAEKRPNILFILTDDQRWDAMGFTGVYPFLETPNMDRLRNEGAYMKNAFVTLSMCAPSRASFLTGMYPHKHGVSDNESLRECDWMKTPSFGQYLDIEGYHTGFIGKWHIGLRNDPRPGFDFWAMFSGQGNYVDNDLNVNGKIVHEPGYVTDVLNRYAKEFIKQDRGDAPFMLFLSHKAVHQPFTPAERHKDLYPDARFPMPETLREDQSNKPLWQRLISWENTVMVNGKVDFAKPNTMVLDWDEKIGFIGRSKNYLQCLSAVDEGIGEILALLEKRGELDNTFIVYAGDNGYLLGEHGRSDKRVAYNDSIRIPMVIRYPKQIKPGTTIEEMVLNIDLAPTLLDLAGAKIPTSIQGRSMLPLFAGNNTGWRDGFLYNYNRDLQPLIPTIVAWRTPDFLLSNTPNRDDLDELYDLRKDPLESNNLINHPEYEPQKQKLLAAMEQAKKDIGFTQNVPDPLAGRWNAEKELAFKFAPKLCDFSADTQIQLPAEKNVDLRYGTVVFEADFVPESDGMILSQTRNKNGVWLYVEDGKINFCYHWYKYSYIVRDELPMLGKKVHVEVRFNNASSKFSMCVNRRPVKQGWFVNVYKPLGETLAPLTLGKGRHAPPDSIGVSQSFTGTLQQVGIKQTIH